MAFSSSWERCIVHNGGVAPQTLIDLCNLIEPVDEVGLRPWSESDVSTLVGAWNDPEIARWNSVPPDPSAEFASAWITGAAVQTVDDIGIDVVMERSETLIGEIGLQVNRPQNIAEIGFWIGEHHRGQGLGTTMLELGKLLGLQLGLRGLVALVDPANERTVQLLEGAGWFELATRSDRRALACRLEGDGATDGGDSVAANPDLAV